MYGCLSTFFNLKFEFIYSSSNNYKLLLLINKIIFSAFLTFVKHSIFKKIYIFTHIKVILMKL